MANEDIKTLMKGSRRLETYQTMFLFLKVGDKILVQNPYIGSKLSRMIDAKGEATGH